MFRIVFVEKTGKVDEETTRELISRELTWRVNEFPSADEAVSVLRDFRLAHNGGVWEVRPT